MRTLKQIFQWFKDLVGPETPGERKKPQDEPLLILEPATVDEVHAAMEQFQKNAIPVLLFLTRRADRQIAFHAIQYFSDQSRRMDGKMIEVYPDRIYLFFPYSKVFHQMFNTQEGGTTIREVDSVVLEHPYPRAHSGAD